jgi:hypothetical protein
MMVRSHQGNQWSYWQQPYFKFNIAHWKNAGYPGGNYPDYHQYDALKCLANNAYPVFYVTNQTLELTELLVWANTDAITNNSPALDVRTISNQHVVATFTVPSGEFFLDSEPEKARKVQIPGQDFIDIIQAVEKTSFKEDLNRIPNLLSEDKGFADTYRRRQTIAKTDNIESQWLVLHNTILNVFDLFWWKLRV